MSADLSAPCSFNKKHACQNQIKDEQKKSPYRDVRASSMIIIFYPLDKAAAPLTISVSSVVIAA